MFGGLANQLKQLLDNFVEKHMVVYAHTVAVVSTCFTVFVIHVHQINIAGDIQLGCAQLAHANHPQLSDCAVAAARPPMAQRNPRQGFAQTNVQGEFGQAGHGACHQF